tara:strand:- start:22956 stop:26252 length:3297 start_codon:yes stop_codon:yes gene_type:complete
MDSFTNIKNKLSLFYKKYYTNELIKGFLLFFLFGMLYFFFTVYIEYFLWLETPYRTLLFLFFFLVEIYLFIKLIIKPTLYLIRLKKGIHDIESSKIIGNYFPDVQDKLLNILQLKESNNDSELLLASIEQKSKDLKRIQFSNAISFKNNITYLKYLIFPFSLFLLSFLSGVNSGFLNSFNRVINPQRAYKPPPPFTFNLQTSNLEVIEGTSLTISLTTKGNVTPDEVKILFNGQEYLLPEKSKGFFYFTFTNILDSLSFYFKSGAITSNKYKLNVVKTPTIQNVELSLSYPRYTKKKNEKIFDTGNIFVPEGTNVSWSITSHQSDTISFFYKNLRGFFSKIKEDNYTYNMTVYENSEYKITSSNKDLKDFENLSYDIRVLKDEPPSIFVTSTIDDKESEDVQFAGQISDDYGISSLVFYFYDVNKPTIKNTILLDVSKDNLQTFFFQFPNQIKLVKGLNYEFFFRVYDNNGIHGFKYTDSPKFTFKQRTNEELEQEQFFKQKSTIENLQKSRLNQDFLEQKLKEFKNEIQNKKNINWSDKKKVDNFIERQKQYNKMMEQHTENMKNTLLENKDDNKALQEKKKDLTNRMDELLKLNKQNKLLDELEKMASKLDKEGLLKKAKQLSQQNKQQERSLERILELTKRFYVEEKTMQIANKLSNLSNKQDTINNKRSNALDKQKNIHNEFNKISEELNELSKDNENLKEPMSIPSFEDEIKTTKKALNLSEEQLKNQSKSKAKQPQQKASQEMKKMSQNLKKTISDMQSNSIDENIDDLRKILENLITFSFKQETLFLKFNKISVRHPDFGSELKKQNDLKTFFEHIDDSLFVLSMRLPKISSKIQTELSNTYYNLDLSLDNFSNNQFDSAASNQQYVITSVNTLSDFLSDLLNNMQNKMGSSGKGGKNGKSFSLPDLIEEQKGISKAMKSGLKKSKGRKGNKSDEESNKEGKKNQSGNSDNQSADEKLHGELFKIYQQQSTLRNRLINSLTNKKTINNVLKRMEDLESEILEKGFNQQTYQRMKELEIDMLKLDSATFDQDKNNKRESNTNTNSFNQKKIKELQLKKEFYNQIEILNRQSLPLQQNFEKKVRKYFSKQSKE